MELKIDNVNDVQKEYVKAIHNQCMNPSDENHEKIRQLSDKVNELSRSSLGNFQKAKVSQR